MKSTMMTFLASAVFALLFSACTQAGRGKNIPQKSGKTSPILGDDKPAAQPGEVAKIVATSPSIEHGFGRFFLANEVLENVEAKLNGVPQIFTGSTLSLDPSCRPREDIQHISEYWTQAFLLSLFSGTSANWLQSAVESLQETAEAGSQFRPTKPIHPNLVARLGLGASSPNMWVLNGIRFRFDKVVQIKLNYELDILESMAASSIPSASLIHSIAVNPKYVEDLIKDLRQASGSGTLVGCNLFSILSKYVLSDGLSQGMTPRSSYFFMHSNIFDVSEGINEWRFAEFKPVYNDTRPYDQQTFDTFKSDLMRSIEKALMGTKAEANLVAEMAKLTFDYRRIPPSPYAFTILDGSEGARLRVVPISFPIFNPTEDGKIALDQTKSPISIWFSGSKTDFGETESSEGSTARVELLRNVDGSVPSEDHPARRFDETLTCAQCHARRVGIDVGSNGKLKEIARMNFRHIGFGDGGNRLCNAYWGVPRVNYRADLSSYLLRIANAESLYGYEIKGTKSFASKVDAPSDQGEQFEMNLGCVSFLAK